MGKIAPFPHQYTVSLAGGRLEATPRAPIAAGPPPQFGGGDTVWSPEELLVAATLECLWTTFDAYARHEGVSATFRGTGTGTLDKGPTGPRFTSIALSVELAVADAEATHARAVLEKAEKHCIISNALNVPVTLEIRTVAA